MSLSRKRFLLHSLQQQILLEIRNLLDKRLYMLILKSQYYL